MKWCNNIFVKTFLTLFVGFIFHHSGAAERNLLLYTGRDAVLLIVFVAGMISLFFGKEE